MSFFDFLGDAFGSVIEDPITSLTDAATAVVTGAMGAGESMFSGLFGGRSDSVAGSFASDMLSGGGADAMAGEASPGGIVGSGGGIVGDYFAGKSSGGGGGGIMSGVTDWVKQNPIPAMVIANAVSGAFSPDAIDVQNNRFAKQMELEEWRRRYAGANTNVSGVNLGMKPAEKPKPAGPGIIRGGA